MRQALTLLAVLSALPLLGGYLGALHPLGDSLAVFRLQGAGLLAVLAGLALLAGARLAGRLGMLLALFAGAPVVWSYGGSTAEGGDLRVYQKNMLYRNDDLAGLAQDIRETAPDAVTLQEVPQANLALLDDLKPELPYQLVCDFVRAGRIAIATRLEPVAGSETCAPGLTALQVQGPKGPVWLVSLHLSWPWPHGQAAQVEALVPVIEGLEGPIVMAGDFNMVRWSWAYSALAKAAGAEPVGAVKGSYTGFAPLLTLPIDHVLSPSGGAVETRAGLGSDHLGLLADVEL